MISDVPAIRTIATTPGMSRSSKYLLPMVSAIGAAIAASISPISRIPIHNSSIGSKT